MARNEWTQQTADNVFNLLTNLASRGYDINGSMRLIINVLIQLVDTEEKSTVMLQKIVEAHNAQAIMLIPTINDTIN